MVSASASWRVAVASRLRLVDRLHGRREVLDRASGVAEPQLRAA